MKGIAERTHPRNLFEPTTVLMLRMGRPSDKGGGVVRHGVEKEVSKCTSKRLKRRMKQYRIF